MLVNLSIPWVILGHSERRLILNESNEVRRPSVLMRWNSWVDLRFILLVLLLTWRMFFFSLSVIRWHMLFLKVWRLSLVLVRLLSSGNLDRQWMLLLHKPRQLQVRLMLFLGWSLQTLLWASSTLGNGCEFPLNYQCCVVLFWLSSFY